MEDLVRRAITTIRDRYEEPLRLDDLAKTATMSKFHFLRTFRNITGVTPLRFLSAVRLQEAKRLLVTTSLDVAEISTQVGYGSLGTFTRRFTECVGMSPTQYRRMARGEVYAMPQGCAPGGAVDLTGRNSGSLAGTVHAVSPTTSTIYCGLFRSRIPQGQPVACTPVARPGSWRMGSVPTGSWYLLAATAVEPADDADGPAEGSRLLVGTAGPVHIVAGTSAYADLTLRPVHWSHPPLLMAIPGIDIPLGRGALTQARASG